MRTMGPETKLRLSGSESSPMMSINAPTAARPMFNSIKVQPLPKEAVLPSPSYM